VPCEHEWGCGGRNASSVGGGPLGALQFRCGGASSPPDSLWAEGPRWRLTDENVVDDAERVVGGGRRSAAALSKMEGCALGELEAGGTSAGTEEAAVIGAADVGPC